MKKINIFKAFTEIDVINKIPKDAKEDWVGLAETLQSVHQLAATAIPSKVVDEAINGWYHEYLHTTYENWPRRKRILKALLILPANMKILPKC